MIDDELGEDIFKILYLRSRSRWKKVVLEYVIKLKKVCFEVVFKKLVFKKVVKIYMILDLFEEDEKVLDLSVDVLLDLFNVRVIVIFENNIKVYIVKLFDELKIDELFGNDLDVDFDLFFMCKCIDCIYGCQKFVKCMCWVVFFERFLYKGEGIFDSGIDDFDEVNKGYLKGKNKKKDDENKVKENGNKNVKKKK